jgi:hypothetical protein
MLCKCIFIFVSVPIYDLYDKTHAVQGKILMSQICMERLLNTIYQ